MLKNINIVYFVIKIIVKSNKKMEKKGKNS